MYHNTCRAALLTALHLRPVRRTAVRALSACAATLALHTASQAQPTPPAPMPIISHNVPAYASDYTQDAAGANSASYNKGWRANRTPSATQPCWLAYDLSKVHPGRVALMWDNVACAYDYTITGGTAYNLPQDYTIDINRAAGGTLPSIGWVTRVRVTSNVLHSRTHVFDMTGFNWVRIRITACAGSIENDDIAIDHMDVWRAERRVQDTWLFLGDSITAAGMKLSDTTFASAVNAGSPAYWPDQENGGIGGWKAGDALKYAPEWLAASPDHYVVLAFGTNDVNTNAGNMDAINQAVADLATLANEVIAAGKVPVIPHVPWANIPGLQANAPVFDAKIDALIAGNPKILAGPDLFAFYRSHPDLIGRDNLHPSDPAGFQAYRNVWATWALEHVYRPQPGR